MEFLWFILIGLAAGWLAGQFMKGWGFGVVGDIVVLVTDLRRVVLTFEQHPWAPEGDRRAIGHVDGQHLLVLDNPRRAGLNESPVGITKITDLPAR